ncbi:MAG: precorrin-6A reductase [Lachnospiraceae bacterium]|nr:precorrin-6A reductase [Lachnospiraceae bacterium]
MDSIFIFSGTTEGRELSSLLAERGYDCTVSVATEYGCEVMGMQDGVSVRTGRLNQEQMCMNFRQKNYLCVIDATHPFAGVVSAEIKRACKQEELPYLRFCRPTEWESEEKIKGKSVFSFDTAWEAASWLKEREGKILLTTGSKDLSLIAGVIADPSRLYARVLPGVESLQACEKAGIPKPQIIACQGPFSVEMNAALLHFSGASYLLTKETGRAGGFPEKMEAAYACQVQPVVIRNPENRNPSGEAGGTEKNQFSFSMFAALIAEVDALARQRKEEAKVSTATEGTLQRILILAGVGTGNPAQQTQELVEALADADVIFGASRILRSLRAPEEKKQALYQADRIREKLIRHPEWKKVLVAYSGDTGFYSGAQSLLKLLHTDAELFKSSFEVKVLCGISSVQYLASKIGKPWQEAKFLSMHGRRGNLIGNLLRYPKCFLLLEGYKQLRACALMLQEAMEKGVVRGLHIYFGYQLGSAEEETGVVTVEELFGRTAEGLYLLYLETEEDDRQILTPGIPDAAFIRQMAEGNTVATEGNAGTTEGSSGSGTIENGSSHSVSIESGSSCLAPFETGGRRTVPMTKAEIRMLALCKLHLTERAVFYDIGGGSGSVSIEAARLCTDGRVYSVEQRADALDLLRRNKERFCCENLEIVAGSAPESLTLLPAPTHVFIGGSDGKLMEILQTVMQKNKNVRIVITCVTLETLAEVQKALTQIGKDWRKKDRIEIIQVAVTKARAAGRYHLFRAQDPVFMITVG